MWSFRRRDGAAVAVGFDGAVVVGCAFVAAAGGVAAADVVNDGRMMLTVVGYGVDDGDRYRCGQPSIGCSLVAVVVVVVGTRDNWLIC